MMMWDEPLILQMFSDIVRAEVESKFLGLKYTLSYEPGTSTMMGKYSTTELHLSVEMWFIV